MRTRTQHYQSWTTLIMAFLALVFSGQEVLAQRDPSCRPERYSASPKTVEATTFSIINQTKDPIIVYWLDFEGKQQKWFDLAPGQTAKQDTYVGHLWLVTKANGRCLRIFAAAPGEFVISEPQSPVHTNRPTQSQNQPTAQPSTSVEDYVAKGVEYYDAKQYAKAIELFKQAIALQPEYGANAVSDALSKRMIVAELAEDPKKEKQEWLLAVKTHAAANPSDAIALILLGETNTALDQDGEALKAFSRAVSIKPKRDILAVVHFELGITYLLMGRKAEARQAYNKLLTLDKKMAQELYEEINKAK